jgi:hypothetical protein
MPNEPAPDDRSATPAPDPEPTEPAAEPTPAEPVAEPAAPPSPPATSPWDADLANRFEDPAQREAVNEFLRATVQPYVTRLEQESAGNRNANRLWEDFREQPADTFLSVAQELFGEDRAEELRRIVIEQDDEKSDVTEPTEYDVSLDELPPEVREAAEFVRDQKRKEAWSRTIEQVRQANPDLKIKDEFFAPFVNATDGDVDLAVQAYKEYVSSFADEYGFKPAETETPDPADEAPTTIGGETRAPTTPPVESKPGSIEDAIDELWNDMQSAKAPQTVGV